MHVFRKVVQLGISASLVAGFSLVAPPVQARDWASMSPRELESTIYGRITRDGVPVSRPKVQVRAWPNQTFLEHAAESVGFQLPVLFNGDFPNSNGTFAVPVNPASMSAQYREPDGAVNYLIFVTDGTNQASWNVSVMNNSTGGVKVATTDGVSELPASLNFDLGASSTVTDHNGTLQVSTAAKSDIFEAPPPCGWTLPGEWHYGRPEYFARLLGTPDAPLTIIEAMDNHHELGIGLDPVGSSGWRMSGTNRTTLGAEVQKSGYVSSHWAWNKVNYRDFSVACAGKFRRPISVRFLMSGVSAAPTPRYTTCDAVFSGIHRKYRGKNITWSAGMDIGVLKVTAQAG